MCIFNVAKQSMSHPCDSLNHDDELVSGTKMTKSKIKKQIRYSCRKLVMYSFTRPEGVGPQKQEMVHVAKERSKTKKSAYRSLPFSIHLYKASLIVLPTLGVPLASIANKSQYPGNATPGSPGIATV